MIGIGYTTCVVPIANFLDLILIVLWKVREVTGILNQGCGIL